MNRFEKLALAAVVIVTFLTVWGSGGPVYDYYLDQIADGMMPIWITGWIIVTYGPIAIAVLFLRLAKRVSRPWIVHLLFLPCAILPLREGEALMLSVIQDPDFDATLSGPLMGGLMLFFFAVIGYFAALIVNRVQPSRD